MNFLDIILSTLNNGNSSMMSAIPPLLNLKNFTRFNNNEHALTSADTFLVIITSVGALFTIFLFFILICYCFMYRRRRNVKYQPLTLEEMEKYGEMTSNTEGLTSPSSFDVINLNHYVNSHESVLCQADVMEKKVTYMVRGVMATGERVYTHVECSDSHKKTAPTKLN